MTEQVSDVPEADTGHSEMRPETVAKCMNGGLPNARVATDLLQFLQDVRVVMSFPIREHESNVDVVLAHKLDGLARKLADHVAIWA
jgi:hypothetical protein